MSNREASLEELLKSAIQSEMNNVYTSIPCVVVAVRDNLSTMMVDIQPSVNQKMKDGTVRERTVIQGVPVQFQVSKTSGFTFPVKVGDTGIALFSMRNIDSWKSGNGNPVTPQNFAKFDKSDAIFIPGIQPIGVAVNNPNKHTLSHDTNDTVVFHNLGQGAECELRLKADGSIQITTSNQPIVITGSEVTVNAESINLNANTMAVNVGNTTWSGNITHNGNYSGTGVQTFNGVVFSTHVHGSSPGPSNP